MTLAETLRQRCLVSDASFEYSSCNDVANVICNCMRNYRAEGLEFGVGYKRKCCLVVPRGW